MPVQVYPTLFDVSTATNVQSFGHKCGVTSASAIISRLKILSKLDLNKNQAPNQLEATRGESNEIQEETNTQQEKSEQTSKRRNKVRIRV